MEIYGLGLVGICMFVGSFIGKLIGQLIGTNGDVGGVGFAMLLMMFFTNYLEQNGRPLSEKTSRGISLLSSLYIPIVVAMSATQNVVQAFSGGIIALLAGVLATVAGLLLVPIISKLGRK